MNEERKTSKSTKTAGKEKKGRKSWAPAKMLDVHNKKDGFRYRWIDNDKQNVRKKLSEGWVIATTENGLKADHDHPGQVNDGSQSKSTDEYRELVLAAIPEEIAEARDEYFQEKTRRQTADTIGGVKNGNPAGKHIKGTITID